ncbi:MAG: hypothetical protein E6I27_17195 [Chloroflexi bacterium]|nr:MAG: hypothetical protein E6I27_17195 [Chloroflexota bacterium]
MNADALLALVRFHAWANDRILTVAAGLSDHEFHRPAKLDHGSAFQTLRHLVDVDWSWREFCIGNNVGDTYVWDHGFALDDLPAIHAFCLEEDVRLRRYVESLDDTALSEALTMREDYSPPRWLILAHVVNHGTQHRSEMARYLTECGRSPGDLDLLDALVMRWPGDGADETGPAAS